MTSAQRSSWEMVLESVLSLARIPGPRGTGWEEAVRTLREDPSFREVDVRAGSRAGVAVFELADDLDLQSFADAAHRLGPPTRLDIVSPPVLEPGATPMTGGPDRRFSLRHTIDGADLWFGIEETAGVERLVSISYHFDC